MNNLLWNYASASVRGASHVGTGTTCQDFNVIRQSLDRQWIAMVASDGAGTASESEVSSKFVSYAFADALIAIAAELASRPPGQWVTDAVIEHVVGLRKQLRSMAKSDDISKFHCTLVAALVGPTGGLTIHLGDGAICGAQSRLLETKTLDLGQNYLVSLPQNGEYANETVFLTERDWVKHLRIDPLPEVDWLILGTDGGMALAMVGERLPKTGFIKPLLESLMLNHDQASRDEAVHSSLADKQADRLTNDDKTLCLLARSKFTHIEGAIQERLSAAVVPVTAPTVAPLSLSGHSPDTTLAVSKQLIRSTESKSRSAITFSLSRREVVFLVALVLVIIGAFFYVFLNHSGKLFFAPGLVKALGGDESISEKSNLEAHSIETTVDPKTERIGPSKTDRDANVSIPTNPKISP